MSYITEPICICEDANTVVLLDQTKGQCMLEHGCPPNRKCPLHGHFARVSGVTDAELPPELRWKKAKAVAA